ncbi:MULTISPECIES: response regulator [unclassified Bosea (in: a-proteobacteria)]|uniref:response regulator n=1 Tax=unclassified Bosea (in: a-proteobacteria) TaxID=2653178 RepID=UPI0009556494|nr:MULTISPECIES: response regulator [unclassified Bosea (in: a-proteobacteria)]TAJ34640.1 MAG: response regulator [Bosea sp. (in: a-proteobacteria)]SIQ28590.1 Response regulator receiver domain-containing protein [Bosea sp. TND4EK4]
MHIAPSFPNLSVLLIDASPHYRRIIRTMLYQAQLHRIFEAADIASAATVFIQKQPNIVILDWDLPDGGGPKCLTAIRSQKTSPFAKAPVLVMMERPDKRAVVQAAKLGAHEIVTKPISPNNLWMHLSGIINVPRKYRENEGRVTLVPRAISNSMF